MVSSLVRASVKALAVTAGVMPLVTRFNHVTMSLASMVSVLAGDPGLNAGSTLPFIV